MGMKGIEQAFWKEYVWRLFGGESSLKVVCTVRTVQAFLPRADPGASWPKRPSSAPTSKSKKLPRVRDGPYPSQIKTSADVPGAKGQIITPSPNIRIAGVTL